MEIPRNTFKQGLKEGRLQIGLWSQLVNPLATEVIAGAGFDFVVVDSEHAPNDVSTVWPQLQVLSDGPTSAIVRVPWNDMVLFKRFLDAGAQTLLVPFVQNAEEARQAVSYMRYPPDGMRGVASCHRANRFGRVKDYLHVAASELGLVVQVETGEALSQLEEIAAVDGVDAVFIGPSDLAASMGHLGNPTHPDVQKDMLAVPERLRASGTRAGILMTAEADARRMIDAGYNFVAVGSDIGLLANHTAALAATYR